MEQNLISYNYLCNKCNEKFEIIRSIKDNRQILCTKCNSKSVEIIIDGGLPPIIKGEPTTLGQLAEKNSKKMGKYKVEEKTRQHKEAKRAASKRIMEEKGIQERNTPIYGKVDHNKLNRMTKEQKEKYILKGD